MNAGYRVVSRFGVLHRVALVNESAQTITLRGKRTFELVDFRPFIESFHGTKLEKCADCFPGVQP